MQLTKRNKRALVVCAVVCAVILLIFQVVLPVYDSQSEIDTVLQQRKRLLKQSIAAIQRRDVFLEQAEQLTASRDKLMTQLLDAANATIAQTLLENIIRELAEQHRVTISRSTPLQPRNVGSYAKVTLQINVQSGMQELADFLQAVATYPQFLAVEDFNMTGFRVRDEVRLQPRLNISCFIKQADFKPSGD